MKTKYLYSVNFWVPFPDSEYGGLLIVTATSDEDCIDILMKAYEARGKGMCFIQSGYEKELKEAVRDAKKFKLSEEHNHDEQKIVMEFTT